MSTISNSSSFDPEKDHWTLVQPMHSKRLAVGVAVVNRLLYAIGGFDGENRLNTVECYHPENNAWSYVLPMKYQRSGAGVAVLNQYIYVVGGFDGTRQLATVERFDTDKQMWDEVKAMKIARSALSVNVIDGKLYAMGGYDGTQFLANVEVFDPQKNEWEDGISLTSGRSGLASAVIYQPSCVQSFMDCMPVCPNRSEYDDDHKKKPFGDKDPHSDNHTNASTSFNFNSFCSQSRYNCGGNTDEAEEISISTELIVPPDVPLTDLSENDSNSINENGENENFNEQNTVKPNLVNFNRNNLLVDSDNELVDIQSIIDKVVVKKDLECVITRFRRRLGCLLYSFVKSSRDRRHCKLMEGGNLSNNGNLPPTNFKRCCIISKFKTRNRNRFSKI